MAKTKRGTTITRTSATPLTPGVPTEAPLRPALTAGSEEAETATARANNPHATGADRTAKIKADVAATRARAAHKRAYGKLPAPAKPVAKPASKPAAKPVAKAAAQASSSANPAFGSPAWRAKYGRKKSAAKPAVTTPIQP